MKLLRTLSKKRLTLIISIGIALITAGSYGAYIATRPAPLPPLSDEPTPAQRQTQHKTDAATKESFLDNNNDHNADNTKDTSQQRTTQAQPAPVPASAKHIELSAEQSSETVVVTTKLREQGFSSGQCVLTITSSEQRSEQHAAIIYQPEYSTCAGFSVPARSLPKGTWHISLAVTPLGGKALTKTLDKEIR